jgi:hypothetical protein
LIQPSPEIILFGDEAGTAEVAREFNLRHEPQVARNQYGTPLLNDLFVRAEAYASFRIMCYINSDILLLGDFSRSVQTVSKMLQKFLMVSRRINICVTDPINFDDDWEGSVRKQAQEFGKAGGHTAVDVFAFAHGTYPQIPDFGIGRLWFDQWLIKMARAKRVPVVDLSNAAPVIHQNHDYNHVAGGADWIWKGKEAEHNLRLYGGIEHAYTLLDITHELKPNGRLNRVLFRRLRYNLWKWAIHDTLALRTRLGLRRKAHLS